jgi:hypothetical protein
MARNVVFKIYSKNAPWRLVGSAGIEPASMNKLYPVILFMAGAIPPPKSDGGLGRN